MTQMIRHCLWVTLVAGVVFFLNLGVPQLWDEDEPKNAACAREMLERGDWVVPMFNYELRTAKPVLLYWFMMTAYEMFGVSEFGARFWSAVLGIGTCLLTYGMGRRLFSPQVGLWSALILAAALMFGVASRAATPDAPLIFFSTLALSVFVWGIPHARWVADPAPAEANGSGHSACDTLRQHIPQAWSTYLWMYAAMGLAVLAKGPVGVALPTLILMGFLWSRNWNTQRSTAVRSSETGSVSRWSVLLKLARSVCPDEIWRIGWVLRPLTAVVIVAAVALPWYVWVGWRTDGAWIAGFLGKHNVSRFVQPLEGHSGPIFYYVIAVLIGFFPWSLFLPLACVRLVQRLRTSQVRMAGDEFCACWAVLYIGFFSLASTKLPSYVLPAYPALALITGRWLVEWLAQPVRTARWVPRSGFATFAAIGLAFVIAIPLLTSKFMPHNWYIGWAGLIPLAGGVIACVQYERQRLAQAVCTFGAASLMFVMSVFGIVAVQINPHQTSAALMAGIFQKTSEPQIAAYDYFEPSLAYYAGRPVKRLKTTEQAVDFLRASPDAYLIIRDKDWNRIQQALGSQVAVLERRHRFLKSGEILLLNTDPTQVASRSTKQSQVDNVPQPKPATDRTAQGESPTSRR